MSKASKFGGKDKFQIFLLVGALLIGAFVLQNFESWRAKEVLAEVEPEIVHGTISSITALPTNTTTSYAVSARLESGELVTLIGSLRHARECKIGQKISVEKRSLHYRFTKERCRASHGDTA